MSVEIQLFKEGKSQLLEISTKGQDWQLQTMHV